jgi:hypothetical protein
MAWALPPAFATYSQGDAVCANNPAIASKLPNAPILIGYNENGVISLPEVLKLAFESFSADFNAALAAGNRTWAGLPPRAPPRRPAALRRRGCIFHDCR